MRDIFLDTETTGLDAKSGHRIIEVGAVEFEDGRPTGREFHHFIDPDREVDAEAAKVNGITSDMLRGQPHWADINDAFCDFIRGGRLLIHNADFDTEFLVSEMTRCNSRESLWALVQDVVNTQNEFRKYDPGQRSYSQDSVGTRFEVDMSSRANRHGALIDATILAEIYYKVKASSTHAIFDYQSIPSGYTPSRLAARRPLLSATPSPEEIAADTAFRDKFLPQAAKSAAAPRKAPAP